MLSYVIKLSIVSLLIIGFLHYFYIYFKNKLTKPKIIDLASNKKIEEINNIIKKNEVKKKESNTNENKNMSDELSNFLNSELKNN